jgi:hypothetical protein
MDLFEAAPDNQLENLALLQYLALGKSLAAAKEKEKAKHP